MCRGRIAFGAAPKCWWARLNVCIPTYLWRSESEMRILLPEWLNKSYLSVCVCVCVRERERVIDIGWQIECARERERVIGRYGKTEREGEKGSEREGERGSEREGREEMRKRGRRKRSWKQQNKTSVNFALTPNATSRSFEALRKICVKICCSFVCARQSLRQEQNHLLLAVASNWTKQNRAKHSSKLRQISWNFCKDKSLWSRSRRDVTRWYVTPKFELILQKKSFGKKWFEIGDKTTTTSTSYRLSSSSSSSQSRQSWRPCRVHWAYPRSGQRTCPLRPTWGATCTSGSGPTRTTTSRSTATRITTSTASASWCTGSAERTSTSTPCSSPSTATSDELMFKEPLIRPSGVKSCRKI